MKKLILMYSICIVYVYTIHMGTVSAQTPIDYNKWDHGDSVYSMQFGGALSNYDDGGTFRAIVNDLVNNGGVYSCSTGVLKTSITDQGVSSVTVTWNEVDYTITQEMIGLRFYRLSDSAYFDIDMSPNWNNISQTGSNILYWGNVFPGVDYELEKTNAQVSHRIYYKPNFLDSMVTLYDLRSDSSDIYLTNIMKYTLSKDIDGYNVPLGNIRKRVLKQLGQFLFSIDEQHVEFVGMDTLDIPEIPVWQRWEKISGKIYMGEFVKCSHLKLIHIDHPTTAIWHNASFTIGGDVQTLVDGTRLYKQSPQNNYGGHADLVVGDQFTPQTRYTHILLRFNTLDDSMRAVGSATWDSARVGLTIDALNESAESLCVTVHKITNNLWEEGTQTGSVGCGASWDSANAVDAGGCPGTQSDWTSDGGDYSATRETNANHPDSVWISADDWSLNDTVYFYISGSTVGDTMGNKAGLLFYPQQYVHSDNDNNIIFDSDDQTSGRPFIEVWYTAGEPGAGAFRGQVIGTVIID